MPNHVTNIINAPKEVLDHLAGPVTYQRWRKGDEVRSEVWGPDAKEWTLEEYQEHVDCDFGTVIPEPSNINRGSENPHSIPEGKVSWYSWNTENWGTKWNAYDVDRRSETDLKFETAWSHPVPVVKALSEKFPNVDIRVRYADEDIGSNLGEYTIRNGVITEDRTPRGEAERDDFASWLNYGKSYADHCAEMDAEEEAWRAEQDAKKAAEAVS